MLCFYVCVVFCNQKTAYEMRISDWSSDVCSSDLFVGIPFRMGERDCLGLFRRYYAEMFGVHVTDYARPVDWESDQIDLIRACHEREGFEMITTWRAKDLRPGDVLCMAIGEGNPNHKIGRAHV